jgi:hypothetical protein
MLEPLIAGELQRNEEGELRALKSLAEEVVDRSSQAYAGGRARPSSPGSTP